MIKLNISFITLFYNQKNNFINNLLPSLYNLFLFLKHNDINLNIEIIILDDGSEENETNELLKYINKFQSKFNIKIIYYKCINNTKNQSRLRNLGIKLSSGDWIYFIDGDDCLLDLNKEDDLNKKKFLNLIKKLNNNNKELYFLDSLQIRDNIFKEQISNLFNHPLFGPETAIYQRNFLNKNHIQFEEEKYNFDTEDLYFYCRILKHLDQLKADNNIFTNTYITYKHINFNSNSFKKLQNSNYLVYMSNMAKDIKKEIKGCVNEEFILNVLNQTLKLEIGRYNKYISNKS